MSSWFTGLRLHLAAQRPQLVRFCYRSPLMRATPTASHGRGARVASILARRAFPAVATKDPYGASTAGASCFACRAPGDHSRTGVGMSRMTGTTVVTAGLGTLVLLNAVLSWGTQRPEPPPQQDIPQPSPATLDTAVALQLRPGAWRRSPAADPAPMVSPAFSPPELPAQIGAPAAQPDLSMASPAEASPARDRGVPAEQLARSMALPSPAQQGSQAALPSAATPPPSLPTVSRSAPGKDRMLLAGPTAEPATSFQIEQDAPHARPTAPQSAPPQAEPPGNAGPLPGSRFGPDSFKRFERNGF